MSTNVNVDEVRNIKEEGVVEDDKARLNNNKDAAAKVPFKPSVTNTPSTIDMLSGETFFRVNINYSTYTPNASNMFIILHTCLDTIFSSRKGNQYKYIIHEADFRLYYSLIYFKRILFIMSLVRDNNSEVNDILEYMDKILPDNCITIIGPLVPFFNSLSIIDNGTYNKIFPSIPEWDNFNYVRDPEDRNHMYYDLMELIPNIPSLFLNLNQINSGNSLNINLTINRADQLGNRLLNTRRAAISGFNCNYFVKRTNADRFESLRDTYGNFPEFTNNPNSLREFLHIDKVRSWLNHFDARAPTIFNFFNGNKFLEEIPVMGNLTSLISTAFSNDLPIVDNEAPILNVPTMFCGHREAKSDLLTDVNLADAVYTCINCTIPDNRRVVVLGNVDNTINPRRGRGLYWTQAVLYKSPYLENRIIPLVRIANGFIEPKALT